MSLPTTFAALTTATGQQLDNNFSALGALTPIPCSVSGTNAITMVTALNTPSVPSYANYAVFSGVAAATNTGGTTVAVNSLSALTVYKDTVAGPVALSGGEIVAGIAGWRWPPRAPRRTARRRRPPRAKMPRH